MVLLGIVLGPLSLASIAPPRPSFIATSPTRRENENPTSDIPFVTYFSAYGRSASGLRANGSIGLAHTGSTASCIRHKPRMTTPHCIGWLTNSTPVPVNGSMPCSPTTAKLLRFPALRPIQDEYVWKLSLAETAASNGPSSQRLPS